MTHAIPPPVLAAARGRPDHPAVVWGDVTLTWRALADRASRWAAALVEAGVGPGTTVALEGTADAEWVARFHAIGLAGAIAAPGGVPGARPWPEGLEPASTLLLERDWPLDEPRLALQTSGTTGEPRTVVLTTAQLVFSAMGSAARLGHHRDDRWLACLPFHHVGGLSILLRTAWLETTAVVEPRFDVPRVSALLGGGAISVVSLVPAMLARILDHRGDRPFPASLRLVLLGGDRAPDALVARARAIGLPVALTWGMTETASQVATSLEDGPLPPLPFARVSAIEGGALVVEGPMASGGRLVTGDRGVVHPSGAVEVHGRRDAVFISGGENVDPLRVERALAEHPSIAEALVMGVPDPVLGHRAAAVLVAAEGSSSVPDLAQIRAFLASKLAPAERPSRVVWAAAIPRGPAGKPSRERARALLEEQS